VPFWLIPLVIIGVLLLLFGVFFVLSRFRGGRYLRPIVQFLLKVPFLGKALTRMSRAALERSNPELASAVRKMERLGASRDPQRAQQALSQLTSAERQAFLTAAGEELQQKGPEPVNREQRRRLERQRKRR
jgi:VIT1/CCC1 family predicted Fe2+/Mn2+ transporter